MNLNTVHHGDCLDWLPTLADNSVDAVVTDPPYELGFMGKHWDGTGIAYNVEMWRQVLRVLKSGGHLLSFGGTRTYHRMACAIEDAGFEIRDQIQWLYGSGFPKSLDVSKAIDKAAGAERAISGVHAGCGIKSGGGSKAMGVSGGYSEPAFSGLRRDVPATDAANQWDGWGTALKPANEPICVARKPLAEKTVAANVLKWGTGAINVDGCRVNISDTPMCATPPRGTLGYGGGGRVRSLAEQGVDTLPGSCRHRLAGRFPANVIHDGSAEVLAGFPQTGGGCASSRPRVGSAGHSGGLDQPNAGISIAFGNSGSAARFFYCAKASTSERDAGLELFAERKCGLMEDDNYPIQTGSGNLRDTRRKNHHPTVKPLSLMRYLCRLVTPPGGIVLEPFCGSGTTCVAAIQEGFRFIACEREAAYIEIARARIAAAQNETPLLAEGNT